MKHTFYAACILALLGCESRNFEATRPDGTVVRYHRMTLFGESSSEGVSIAKAGDDLAVDVGPTGSETNVQAAIEAFGYGVSVGKAQGGSQ